MPDASPGVVDAERDLFFIIILQLEKWEIPSRLDLSSRMVLAVIFCSSRFWHKQRPKQWPIPGQYQDLNQDDDQDQRNSLLVRAMRQVYTPAEHSTEEPASSAPVHSPCDWLDWYFALFFYLLIKFSPCDWLAWFLHYILLVKQILALWLAG